MAANYYGSKYHGSNFYQSNYYGSQQVTAPISGGYARDLYERDEQLERFLLMVIRAFLNKVQ
jgi:hypothetical protein